MGKTNVVTDQPMNRIYQELAERFQEDEARIALLGLPKDRAFKKSRFEFLGKVHRDNKDSRDPADQRMVNAIEQKYRLLEKEVYNTPLRRLIRDLSGGRIAKDWKALKNDVQSNVSSDIKSFKNGIQNVKNLTARAQANVKDDSKAFKEGARKIPSFIDRVKSNIKTDSSLLSAGLKKIFGKIASFFKPLFVSNNAGLSQLKDFDENSLGGESAGLARKSGVKVKTGSRHSKQENPQVDSYQELVSFLTKLGYQNHIHQLEAALERGESIIATKWIVDNDGKNAFQQLNFSKDDSGKLVFDSIETNIPDVNNPGQYRMLTTFPMGETTFSSEEALQLANGDHVSKTVEDKDG